MFSPNTTWSDTKMRSIPASSAAHARSSKCCHPPGPGSSGEYDRNMMESPGVMSRIPRPVRPAAVACRAEPAAGDERAAVGRDHLAGDEPGERRGQEDDDVGAVRGFTDTPERYPDRPTIPQFLRHQCLVVHLEGLGDVGGDGVDPHAVLCDPEGADSLDVVLGPLLVDLGDDDVGTGPGEGVRGCLTDAASSAGYDRDLAGQIDLSRHPAPVVVLDILCDPWSRPRARHGRTSLAWP